MVTDVTPGGVTSEMAEELTPSSLASASALTSGAVRMSLSSARVVVREMEALCTRDRRRRAFSEAVQEAVGVHPTACVACTTCSGVRRLSSYETLRVEV
jgi:NAD-dependent dihydropyrimidine dehydrogenase PreA subunit